MAMKDIWCGRSTENKPFRLGYTFKATLIADLDKVCGLIYKHKDQRRIRYVPLLDFELKNIKYSNIRFTDDFLEWYSMHQD